VLDSDRVQQDAGVSSGQLDLARENDAVRVKVTAATAPLAVAQCSSIVLAGQLHAKRAGAERRWVDMAVDQLRDELNQLERSLVVAPPNGACSGSDSISSLKTCVEGRLAKLTREDWTPEKHLSNCERGQLCSIARAWAAEERRRSELAKTYGEAHPDMKEAARARDALRSWFERQRKTEVAALRAMRSRIEEAPSSPPANAVDVLRVEVALERLDDESFSIDAGVSGVAPWPTQLASYEYGVERIELRRLEARYKQKHPAMIAQKARLERMREDFDVLVDIQRARLETLRATLENDEDRRSPDDARLQESHEALEQLLDVLETAQALPASDPLDVQVVEACSVSGRSPDSDPADGSR
jgi:hypothetical protein